MVFDFIGDPLPDLFHPEDSLIHMIDNPEFPLCSQIMGSPDQLLFQRMAVSIQVLLHFVHKSTTL